jgi:hypothetical protein
LKLAKKTIEINILAIEIIQASSELISIGKIPNPNAVTVLINENRKLQGNLTETTWKVVKDYMTTNLKIKELKQ